MISLTRYSILLTLIAFVFCHHTSNAQFRQVYVDNYSEDNHINKLSFYSASEGFAAFSSWIGYTSDSGHTFTKKVVSLNNVDFNGYYVNITFGFVIKGVKAFDRNNIITYGHYGFVPSILYSADGGITFKLVYNSQFDPLNLKTGITDMIFPQNSNIGYAIDADRILKTIDKGHTWTTIRTDPGSYFDHLEAVDDNNLITFSTDYYSNKLLKTSNAGLTWNNVSMPLQPTGNIQCAYFLNPNVGWLSMINNNDDYFYKTVNGGINWNLQNDIKATPFACTKMFFTDENNGYALGNSYAVYKTNNSGTLWEPLSRDNQFSYLSYSHNDLHYFKANQVWAGGGHGFLELTTNGGGATLPMPYFLIDTTAPGNAVNLVNFSKSTHSFKWYVNNKLVDTTYHTSYTHSIYSSLDSVKLVVSDEGHSDSVTKYQSFIPALPPAIPVINDFSPSSGYTGAVITINGSNFTGTYSLKLGGTTTSFKVISPTQITATVGAGSSGDITVENTNGVATASGFIYYSRLKITSVVPSKGAPGSTVIINGSNFNLNSSMNIVRFGSVKATVISSSASQLIVKVPYGATPEPISVSVNGVTVSSSFPFYTTFNKTCDLKAAAFSDTTEFYLDIYGANKILTSDLDGDGRVDLIAPSILGAPDRILLLRNESLKDHFSFSKTVYLSTSDNYYGAADCTIQDMDADGKPDILVPVLGQGFFIYRNTSTPGIISFAKGLFFQNNYGATPKDLKAEDLDGDGLPEVFGFHFSDIVVFKNNTAGGIFSFPVKGFLYLKVGNGGGDIINCQVADIDRDGKKDIITYSNFYSEYKISIFKNTTVNGNISFESPETIVFPSSFALQLGVTNFQIADLDIDGRTDILVLKGKLVSTVRNISDPKSIIFDTPKYLDVSVNINNLKTADLDGDGKPEILMSYVYNKPVIVLPNISTVGNIEFGPQVGVAKDDVITSMGNGFSTAADFDLDGKNDLAVFNNHFTYSNNGASSRPTIAIFKNSLCSDAPVEICLGGTVTLKSNTQGATYKWQQNTGNGFVDIDDNVNFAGTSTDALKISNISSNWYGYKFRCEVNNVPGMEFTLNVSNYWTGKTNSNWNNADNWSCGVVPDANTDVIINGGVVLLNADGTCRSIQIMPGVSFNIQQGTHLSIMH